MGGGGRNMLSTIALCLLVPGFRQVSGTTRNPLIVRTKHYTTMLYVCFLYQNIAENRLNDCVHDKNVIKVMKIISLGTF